LKLTLFLVILKREILKYCEKRPEVVDRKFWYLWVLEKLGLKHEHETFKEMLLKDSFSGLRGEQKGFGVDFHSIALSLQFRAGWIVFMAFL